MWQPAGFVQPPLAPCPEVSRPRTVSPDKPAAIWGGQMGKGLPPQSSLVRDRLEKALRDKEKALRDRAKLLCSTSKKTHILSTPFENERGRTMARSVKAAHENTDEFCYNPNEDCTPAKLSWLLMWLEICNNSVRTGGTVFILYRSDGQGRYGCQEQGDNSLDGEAQPGEIKYATQQGARIKWVDYAPNAEAILIVAPLEAAGGESGSLGLAETPEQQLADVMERRRKRKMNEQQQRQQRLSSRPLVVPPTSGRLEALEARQPKPAADERSPAPAYPPVTPDPDARSTTSSGPVTTFVTIKVEGKLDGFDFKDFKERLAHRLRRHDGLSSEQVHIWSLTPGLASPL